MGAPGDERRRENHIRSISRLFLSRSPVPLGEPVCEYPHRIVVEGCDGSPWALALAMSLALSAWRREEAAVLVLPGRLLAASARLLGAGERQLGLDMSRGDGEIAEGLEPLGGLRLIPVEYLALLPEDGEGWRFHFHDCPELRGPRLRLMESDAELLPTKGRGDPLFILGLGFQPTPRKGITGIWGPLARRQLLDPDRDGAPTLMGADPRLLKRFQGFLEALGRFPAAKPATSRRSYGVVP
jgi:hypothetical protein